LKEKFLDTLVQHFEEYAMYTGQDPCEIYNIEQWPADFDINDETNVKPVELAKLKEQP